MNGVKYPAMLTFIGKSEILAENDLIIHDLFAECWELRSLMQFISYALVI